MIERGLQVPFFYKYIKLICIGLDILLSLLIWLHGITIKSAGNNCANPDLMGMYQTGKKEILICADNFQKHRISKSEVIKHEFVHYVYDFDKVKKTIIPDPYFTFLVKHFMSDDEKLPVILYEKDYSVDEELEARFLSRLPTIVLFFI